MNAFVTYGKLSSATRRLQYLVLLKLASKLTPILTALPPGTKIQATEKPLAVWPKENANAINRELLYLLAIKYDDTDITSDQINRIKSLEESLSQSEATLAPRVSIKIEPVETKQEERTDSRQREPSKDKEKSKVNEGSNRAMTKNILSHAQETRYNFYQQTGLQPRTHSPDSRSPSRRNNDNNSRHSDGNYESDERFNAYTDFGDNYEHYSHNNDNKRRRKLNNKFEATRNDNTRLNYDQRRNYYSNDRAPRSNSERTPPLTVTLSHKNVNKHNNNNYQRTVVVNPPAPKQTASERAWERYRPNSIPRKQVGHRDTPHVDEQKLVGTPIQPPFYPTNYGHAEVKLVRNNNGTLTPLALNQNDPTTFNATTHMSFIPLHSGQHSIQLTNETVTQRRMEELTESASYATQVDIHNGEFENIHNLPGRKTSKVYEMMKLINNGLEKLNRYGASNDLQRSGLPVLTEKDGRAIGDFCNEIQVAAKVEQDRPGLKSIQTTATNLTGTIREAAEIACRAQRLREEQVWLQGRLVELLQPMAIAVSIILRLTIYYICRTLKLTLTSINYKIFCIVMLQTVTGNILWSSSNKSISSNETIYNNNTNTTTFTISIEVTTKLGDDNIRCIKFGKLTVITPLTSSTVLGNETTETTSEKKREMSRKKKKDRKRKNWIYEINHNKRERKNEFVFYFTVLILSIFFIIFFTSIYVLLNNSIYHVISKVLTPFLKHVLVLTKSVISFVLTLSISIYFLMKQVVQTKLAYIKCTMERTTIIINQMNRQIKEQKEQLNQVQPENESSYHNRQNNFNNTPTLDLRSIAQDNTNTKVTQVNQKASNPLTIQRKSTTMGNTLEKIWRNFSPSSQDIERPYSHELEPRQGNPQNDNKNNPMPVLHLDTTRQQSPSPFKPPPTNPTYDILPLSDNINISNTRQPSISMEFADPKSRKKPRRRRKKKTTDERVQHALRYSVNMIFEKELDYQIALACFNRIYPSTEGKFEAKTLMDTGSSVNLITRLLFACYPAETPVIEEPNRTVEVLNHQIIVQKATILPVFRDTTCIDTVDLKFYIIEDLPFNIDFLIGFRSLKIQGIQLMQDGKPIADQHLQKTPKTATPEAKTNSLLSATTKGENELAKEYGRGTFGFIEQLELLRQKEPSTPATHDDEKESEIEVPAYLFTYYTPTTLSLTEAYQQNVINLSRNSLQHDAPAIAQLQRLDDWLLLSIIDDSPRYWVLTLQIDQVFDKKTPLSKALLRLPQLHSSQSPVNGRNRRRYGEGNRLQALGGALIAQMMSPVVKQHKQRKGWYTALEIKIVEKNGTTLRNAICNMIAEYTNIEMWNYYRNESIVTVSRAINRLSSIETQHIFYYNEDELLLQENGLNSQISVRGSANALESNRQLLHRPREYESEQPGKRVTRTAEIRESNNKPQKHFNLTKQEKIQALLTIDKSSINRMKSMKRKSRSRTKSSTRTNNTKKRKHKTKRHHRSHHRRKSRHIPAPSETTNSECSNRSSSMSSIETHRRSKTNWRSNRRRSKSRIRMTQKYSHSTNTDKQVIMSKQRNESKFTQAFNRHRQSNNQFTTQQVSTDTNRFRRPNNSTTKFNNKYGRSYKSVVSSNANTQPTTKQPIFRRFSTPHINSHNIALTSDNSDPLSIPPKHVNINTAVPVLRDMKNPYDEAHYDDRSVVVEAITEASEKDETYYLTPSFDQDERAIISTLRRFTQTPVRQIKRMFAGSRGNLFHLFTHKFDRTTGKLTLICNKPETLEDAILLTRIFTMYGAEMHVTKYPLYATRDVPILDLHSVRNYHPSGPVATYQARVDNYQRTNRGYHKYILHILVPKWQKKL